MPIAVHFCLMSNCCQLFYYLVCPQYIFPFFRVLVELAIPCVKSGPRVFKGFTVGFHPRSSEIVSSSCFLAIILLKLVLQITMVFLGL